MRPTHYPSADHSLGFFLLSHGAITTRATLLLLLLFFQVKMKLFHHLEVFLYKMNNKKNL